MSTALRCLVLTVGLLLSASSFGIDFTTVVNLPGDPVPNPIRSGTQINIWTGIRYTKVDNSIGPNAVHGELNLLGAELYEELESRNQWVFNLIAGRISSARAQDESTMNVGHMQAFNSLHAIDSSRVNIEATTIGNIYGYDRSQLSMTGGSSRRFQLFDEATATISSGSNTSHFQLKDQSRAAISGGHLAGDVHVLDDSELVLHGAEFRLDGVPITFPDGPDASVEMPLEFGRQLSGVLADGTVVQFTHQSPHPQAVAGRLRLVSTPIPEITPQYTIPGDEAPYTIRDGERLVLLADGSVPSQFAAHSGSLLGMAGGRLGDYFRAYDAQVVIAGGEIGRGFRTADATETLITGGTFVDASFTSGSAARVEGGTFEETWLTTGSTLHMTGGTTSRVVAEDQSHFTLAGGLVNGHTAVDSESQITFAGGVMAGVLKSRGAVRVVGGQFAIDGEPIEGLTNPGETRELLLPEGKTLTAILADGTPFVLSPDDGDDFFGRPLTLEAQPIPAAEPKTFYFHGSFDRTSLREGQRLQIPRPAQVEDYFRAGPGSAIDILGGWLGDHFEAAGVTIDIQRGDIHTGFKGFAGTVLQVNGGGVGNGGKLWDSRLELNSGELGNNFQLNRGSTAVVHDGQIGYGFVVDSHSLADIHGGTFGNGLSVGDGAVVNLHAGRLGRNTRVHDGGTLNVEGGSIGANLTVYAGGKLHVAGGKLSPHMQIEDDGTLTLVGTHFELKQPLTDPATGEPMPLSQLLDPYTPYLLEARNTTLTATLADGSPFKLVLYTTAKPDRDWVAEGARVYLKLVAVPEPATALLATLGCGALLAVRRPSRGPHESAEMPIFC